eukprot:CFRG2509T1
MDNDNSYDEQPAGQCNPDTSPGTIMHLFKYPKNELIDLLAPLLEQLMEQNNKLKVELTSFHAQSRPPISIHSYLKRFGQYAQMPNECYILLLVYLDRIGQNYSSFCINSFNAHRMILTGLVLAAKFSQDRYFTNTHYARVGGLPGRELKALELEFLARITYTLWADSQLIEAYWQQLLQYAQRKIDTAKLTSRPVVNASISQDVSVSADDTTVRMVDQESNISQVSGANVSRNIEQNTSNDLNAEYSGDDLRGKTEILEGHPYRIAKKSRRNNGGQMVSPVQHSHVNDGDFVTHHNKIVQSQLNHHQRPQLQPSPFLNHSQPVHQSSEAENFVKQPNRKDTKCMQKPLPYKKTVSPQCNPSISPHISNDHSENNGSSSAVHSYSSSTGSDQSKSMCIGTTSVNSPSPLIDGVSSLESSPPLNGENIRYKLLHRQRQRLKSLPLAMNPSEKDNEYNDQRPNDAPSED